MGESTVTLKRVGSKWPKGVSDAVRVAAYSARTAAARALTDNPGSPKARL